MSELTNEKLDELAAIEKLATPAPWQVDPERPFIVMEDAHNPADIAYAEETHDDAALIAAIRNAAPALIAAARERNRLVDVLHEIVANTDDPFFAKYIETQIEPSLWRLAQEIENHQTAADAAGE